jgi:hypothetical protein
MYLILHINERGFIDISFTERLTDALDSLPIIDCTKIYTNVKGIKLFNNYKRFKNINNNNIAINEYYIFYINDTIKSLKLLNKAPSDRNYNNFLDNFLINLLQREPYKEPYKLLLGKNPLKEFNYFIKSKVYISTLTTRDGVTRTY